MIYCVEDDASIRQLVVYTLTNSGLPAEGMESWEELAAALKTKKPSLILLDIMLPGRSGLEILRTLRDTPSLNRIPVIMLTAKGSEFDKVLGLDSGADDYITKPFGMTELISRVRALLRRTGEDNPGVFSLGGVNVDLISHRVFANGAEVVLTLKEFELLVLLMKNPGKVFTRDTLLETVWGYDYTGETRTVDVHVRTLRLKLGDCGDIIETVRGIGYRIGGGI